MGIQIKRGDIFFADLEKGVGSEQSGNRPVLVIQNNVGNLHSPTILIVPITSKVGKKANLPTHCPVMTEFLEKDSIVLFEQMRTIDKKRFGRYLGRIDVKQMNAFGKAIKISTGLVNPQKKENKNAKQYF